MEKGLGGCGEKEKGEVVWWRKYGFMWHRETWVLFPETLTKKLKLFYLVLIYKMNMVASLTKSRDHYDNLYKWNVQRNSEKFKVLYKGQ